MKKKTLYKVLKNNMISPFQRFKFEIGKEYKCNDFDTKNIECSTGFYATDLDGIIYSYINNGKFKIFECEVWGKEKEFDQFKRRYEYIILKKELTQNDLENRFLKKKYNINYYRAIYPIDPREINTKRVCKKDLELLKKWDSIRYPIRYSIWDSIRNSIGDSIGGSIGGSVGGTIRDSIRDSVEDSVWGSVEDSVWDSVYGYISSMFLDVKKWQYIEYKEGINPFQSGIDLWNRGLVPSFDGKLWRLHGGKNMDILWEGEIKCKRKE